MNSNTLARVQASLTDRPITSVTIGGGVFEMPDSQEAVTQSAIAQSASAEEASINLADPKRFILAGRAIFTLQGKETRYTYRVNRADPKEGSSYTHVAYFVSLLTGPDNTSDYTYLGMVDPQSGAVKLTRKSQYTDQSKPVLAVRWAFGLIWAGRPLPEPAKIYHVGRCGRCGRALTVPSSIEAGIGPECAGKLE